MPPAADARLRKVFLFLATMAGGWPYRLYVNNPSRGPENFLAHLLPGRALHGANFLAPKHASCGKDYKVKCRCWQLSWHRLGSALRNGRQIIIERHPCVKMDGK